MTSPTVPYFIDAEARHPASVMRTLAWAAVEGKQGILHPSALAPRALDTPGSGLMVDPGPFTVNARHPGGEFENYVDKLPIAEFVPVNPNNTASVRTDLVIMRIENPYSGEPNNWTPVDPENGPYRRLVAVEGVPNGLASVAAWNDTWSAIPVCRVRWPAFTGALEPDFISDLRSLAELGGDRLTDIDWPDPIEPPPIASQYYTNFNPSEGDPNYGNPSGGSDNVHDYFIADTGWKSWPEEASWNVPVPEWATSMDIEMTVMNAQILNGDLYGELRMLLDGSTATAPLTVAIDYVDQPGRHNVQYGTALAVPSGMRGQVVQFRTQMRSHYSFTGVAGGRRMDAKGGTTSRLAVNFKRNPVL